MLFSWQVEWLSIAPARERPSSCHTRCVFNGCSNCVFWSPLLLQLNLIHVDFHLSLSLHFNFHVTFSSHHITSHHITGSGGEHHQWHSWRHPLFLHLRRRQVRVVLSFFCAVPTHCCVLFPCCFVFSPLALPFALKVSCHHHNFSLQLTNIHSKLKELSRRTTFIRVSQQLNEVFGSKDESKHPVFAAIPDHSLEKTSAEPDAKKARND